MEKVKERGKESIGQVLGVLLHFGKFCGHGLIEGTPGSGHGLLRLRSGSSWTSQSNSSTERSANI